MRFLWIGARKDIDQVRRDPFGLLIPIGIPLCLAILMNMVFGRSGEATPHGVLLMADEDRSIASSMVAGIFQREPLDKMIEVRQVTAAEGRKRIDRGEASAFLIVPSGLQEAVLRNRQVELQLITNPAERIIPGIIEQTLRIAVEAGFYMQKLAPPQSTNVASAGATFQHIAGTLSRYFQPPLIQIESQSEAVQNTFNFAALFFPSMIFMSLMMVANSLAGEIWKERTAGTLRRLAATPVSLTWYLAGRLLFVGFVLACIGTVGVLSVHWMAGVPVSSFPAAVVWVIFSGIALYLCLLSLVMGAHSQRTANIMGNMVIFPLAMVGGCFFPFAIMPEWMVKVGQMTPNGWAVMQFQAILGGQVSAASLAGCTAGLLAVSALAFALSIRRMQGFLR